MSKLINVHNEVVLVHLSWITSSAKHPTLGFQLNAPQTPSPKDHMLHASLVKKCFCNMAGHVLLILSKVATHLFLSSQKPL